MNTTEDEILDIISRRIDNIRSIIGSTTWICKLGNFYHPIRLISFLSDDQIHTLSKYGELSDHINLFLDIKTRTTKHNYVEIVVCLDTDVNPEEWTNNYIVGAITQIYPLSV